MVVLLRRILGGVMGTWVMVGIGVVLLLAAFGMHDLFDWLERWDSNRHAND